MKNKKMNKVIKNSVGLRGTISEIESYFQVAFSKHVKAHFELGVEKDSSDLLCFLNVSDFLFEYTFSIHLLPTMVEKDAQAVYYITGSNKMDKGEIK